MAQKKNIQPPIKQKPASPEGRPQPAPAVAETPARDMQLPAWLYDFKVQAVIVALLAFGFYCNTFSNESALDDTLLITDNEYVYQGFAGIPSLLSTDAYYSYYKHMGVGNQLSGGRYRPLSLVNFAIEQQFLGAIPQSKIDSVMQHAGYPGPQHDKLVSDMHVRHAFNVLWFTLSVIVLLWFLRYVVFRGNHIMAFLAAVIFAIHPIHTEVVANVKSRDEILSLLFICLTFICAFKYREQKKMWLLVAGLAGYFLAFLSKEYAIGLVVLLPLAFYMFGKETPGKSIVAALPYAGIAVLFLIIRSQIIDPSGNPPDLDILNNPYGFASATERLATILATPLNYLRLLIFPHPLTSDYSYNTIPYKDFASLLVWLSVVVHLGLLWLCYKFTRQRNVLGFAIAFYLVNLALVCNLFFNIGATMSERLIYHSSVGFAIAVGYLLYKGMEKIPSAAAAKTALAGLMVVLIALCGMKTIARNADWKNNYTLFPQDLKASPNSVMLNAYVAAAYVDQSVDEKDTVKKKAELHEAVHLFDKAISLDTTYVTAYINRGRSWYDLGEADSDFYNLNKAREMLPGYAQLPELFYNNAVLYMNKHQYQQAMNALQISLKLNPNFTPSRNAMTNIINAGVLGK